ncbi:MAG: hypothetical protein UF420_08890, partial [Ellagibacter isourolithinifaciens]|uniref:hypothetical protein n=1 Tax=Ellagibacter isourolithinifaciens TaxID=2137581 RepID=UPI002E78BE30
CSNSPRCAAELRAGHAATPRGLAIWLARPNHDSGSVLKQSSLRCGTALGARRHAQGPRLGAGVRASAAA